MSGQRRRGRLWLAWQLRLFRIHAQAQALGTLAIRFKMQNILLALLAPITLFQAQGDSVLFFSISSENFLLGDSLQIRPRTEFFDF